MHKQDEYDWKNAVSGIKIPVLIVAGSRDSVAKVGSLAGLLASLEFSELVVIEKAGHTMILDEQESLKILIEKFIKKITSSGRS